MQAAQITRQRTTNPSPWAQPKYMVSLSNPGASQKTTRPVKTASSTHESHLTQTNRRPGTGFRRGLFTVEEAYPGAVGAYSSIPRHLPLVGATECPLRGQETLRGAEGRDCRVGADRPSTRC